ncbi:MAG TPA: SipW-dependent-type signal peptide-containing protein [Cellulomonas sp.]
MLRNRAASKRPGVRGRGRALLAAGGVVGVGAAVTLAAWTDTEWVYGGTGDPDTPIGSSVFEVQQNVYDGAGFVDRETQAGAGALDFTIASGTLSPGAVVYAPMQLRATAGSVGGTVVLTGAVAGTGTDAALFAVLRYQVRTGVAAASCDAAGMAGAGADLVAAGSTLATAGTGTFTLPPAPDATTPGTPVDVCFAMTFPATSTDPALQGLAAIPVWNFVATSA